MALRGGIHETNRPEFTPSAEYNGDKYNKSVTSETFIGLCYYRYNNATQKRF